VQTPQYGESYPQKGQKTLSRLKGRLEKIKKRVEFQGDLLPEVEPMH
jgi:hypothetical protein